MGKKVILIVVAIAIVAVAVVLALALLKGGSRGLFAQLLAKESEASGAYGAGNYGVAKAQYTEAKALLDSLEQKYPDAAEVRSPEFLKVKDRCRGRLASMTSPGETVGAMLELMQREEGRQYLEYWDFDAMGEGIFGDKWPSVTQQQRDDLRVMMEDMVDEGIKQGVSEIRKVQFSVRNEKIDGDKASVDVAFRVDKFQIDVNLDVTKTSGVWKVLDFASMMTSDRQGLTHYLRLAFDHVLENRTLEQFLASPTHKDDLEEAVISVTRQDLSRFDRSMKGNKIRVTKQAKIMSGPQVLIVAEPGEVFQVIRDQEDDSGRWYLVSFVRPETGKGEFGWLPADSVEPVKASESEAGAEDAQGAPVPQPTG